MKLNELFKGEKGKIIKVEGDRILKRRLRDMGVIPGEIIEVVRIAPLGDPLEIKVKGYYLSLRKREAEKITVEKV
ncbi:ferrous iron transport protein A [Candidatus Calescamantes bacterium]|nr:ferrous iron transport protein A [Candidatus Calescamantes bacterium]